MYPSSWWNRMGAAFGQAVATVLVLCFVTHLAAAPIPEYVNLQPITANLDAPTTVAVGPDERIFVAEPSNRRVQVYDSAGRYLDSLSGLDAPSAVAVANDGRLYVADAERGRVVVYTKELKPASVLGGDGEFIRPVAMAVDAAGAVYVLDAKAHRVKVYNPDHSFRFAFGERGTGDGMFSTTTGLAVDDRAGEILVVDLADPGNGAVARIQVFDLNGVFKRRIPTGGRPTGVAVDRAGRIYFADAYKNMVLVLDSLGTYLGTLSNPDRPLLTPVGMAYAPRTGRLFIAARRGASVEVYGIDDYQTELRQDDADGMPEAWELAHGLDPWDGTDAAKDPDGDGFTNLQEYEAHSDPHDALSNPGRLRFGTDGLRVGEGAGGAVLEVVREGGSVGAAAVLCHTLAGTADAGGDYAETSAWLEWADGDAVAKVCAVPLIDDDQAEGDESYQLALASPDGARLASPDSVRVVIADNDLSRAANDFNGDGKSDVLLRDRISHAWHYYPMRGSQVLEGAGPVELTRDRDWIAVGTGDYDGDGKADVLMRHARTQAWRYYPMNGAQTPTGAVALGLPADAQWLMMGSGDFNGDGKADVLLRHAKSRQWHYYPLDGGRVLSDGGRVDLPRGVDWQLAGIGDFDGDGKDEVLLPHANGQQWRYYSFTERRGQRADDRTDTGAGLAAPRDWQLAGIGDLDGDGGDDLLLRHTRTGQWYFQPWPRGADKQAAARPGALELPRDRQWQVAGIGDYNGDGSADVLLRHAATGQWQYHPFKGGQPLADTASAPLSTDVNWLSVRP